MKKRPQDRLNESGQVALAILLIMMVVLVVSVAVSTRTSKDIVQTIQTTQATRVFSAAESGAEDKLNSVLAELRAGTIPASVPAAGGGLPAAMAGETAVDTTLTNQTELIQQLAVGQPTQLVLDTDGNKLSDYSGDQVNLTWTGDASLIISRYDWDGSEVKVQYVLVAACGPDKGDGFQVACSGTTNTYNLATLNSTAIVRILPVYSDTTLTATGVGVELPPQQFVITAQAVNTETDIQESSSIQVTSTHLLPLPFLDYALYSGGDIVK